MYKRSFYDVVYDMVVSSNYNFFSKRAGMKLSFNLSVFRFFLGINGACKLTKNTSLSKLNIQATFMKLDLRITQNFWNWVCS